MNYKLLKDIQIYWIAKMISNYVKFKARLEDHTYRSK